jgi:NAD(P)H-nitrite reductase large subunit
MRRYAIIGTGVAGFSAAQAIRQQDASCRIDMIGDDPHGYYSRPGLAYYLTGELNEAQLYPAGESDFRRLEINRRRAHVCCIDPHAHCLRLQDGSSLAYDRLLIATGSTATPLHTPGCDAEGVVKLDHLNDARKILRLASRARRAVVVGGGITALEIVEGLVTRGVKTHYFLRGDRYWSNVLDETESRIVEHRLKEDGVTIHYHSELEEILVERDRVVAVLTKDQRRIVCDLVAFAIGVRPRKMLAEVSNIRTERGILVDETLQTDQADIFAAGDVAQVTDPITGEAILNTLWAPARQQGTVAGLNMAGVTTCYRQQAPLNVTRLANLTTTIVGRVGRGDDMDLIGIARGDSETWRRLPDAIAAQANFAVNRLRILVGRQTLLGAIVMGDQTLSRPLHHLVSQNIDITPIRSQLLAPDAPIADLIAAFWVQYRTGEQACPAETVSSGPRW